MDVSSGQAREQLRAALEELGANPALFKDVHLDKLWVNDYRGVSTLRDASREGLKDAGLAPALIDHILMRTGGGAGGAAAGTDTSASLVAAGIVAQLLLTDFDYTASKGSRSQQGDNFKAQLQTFYGNTADAEHKLYCTLLNLKLPKTLVTGAHLFKYCWKVKLPYVLRFNNINDPRNGLLLFKPLEHAFDDARICVVYVTEAGEPKFKLKLLDQQLKGMKVWEYAKTHNLCENFDDNQIDKYAATVTFGDLEGKALVFQNGNRPYQRCLGFQAWQAMRQAKERGWLPGGWGPAPELTYISDEQKERIHAWLALAGHAPPLDWASSEDE